MNFGPMAEALAPLRARMPRAVTEREILRVVGRLADREAMDQAIREALAWAQNRCGGQLPKKAWDGESFEYLAGGRTTLAERIDADDVSLWALRADDPDKNVAGRTWTTEISIGKLGSVAPTLSVRLSASTSEDSLEIVPHVPGVVWQVNERCGLAIGKYALKPAPWVVESDEDVRWLIELLEDPERRLPVFVASGDERADDPDVPLVDVPALARATIGLAHVVAIPAAKTYALSDAFGKMRSVYHGAVRVYFPGFAADASPYDHPLMLSERLREPGGVERCVTWLRRLAAQQSLFRWRLDKDVLTFSKVRSAAVRKKQEAHSEASFEERLQLAEERVQALQKELEDEKKWGDQLAQMHDEMEERARHAEAQLNAVTFRIQQLLEQFEQKGETPDARISLPTDWRTFAEWCESSLIGRVALAARAKRNVKEAVFEDVQLAAKCLLWLANDYHKRRLQGGGDVRDAPVAEGIRNAPCGADTFEFDFQGRRLRADWHIKNGGNTRDPRRCLRIYYAWDDQTQQVVIADMPAHRRTGAT